MSGASNTWTARFLVQLDKDTQKTFDVEVHNDWAPLGAKRFLDLINVNYYDNCRIYRVIPGFIIQWGIAHSPDLYSKWGDNKIKDDKRKSSTPSNLRGKYVEQGIQLRVNSRVYVVCYFWCRRKRESSICELKRWECSAG